MKNLIAGLCVYVLRKCKHSTIIGYEIEGGEVRCKYKNASIYDNNLDVDYYLENGRKFDIPDGKFSYTEVE